MKISVEGLSKTYKGGTTALSGVDLDIGSGMFGLLGPNGAGKTTLMRILVTLMKPTGCNVRVNELDLQKNRREIRSMLGYLPQEFRFFSKLTTWEFLDYVARLAGLKEAKKRTKAVGEMLEQVGLYDVRDRLANKLSGGMKRRLGIAQALIGEPKIIVVDEPTTGLDPEERHRNHPLNPYRRRHIEHLPQHGAARPRPRCFPRLPRRACREGPRAGVENTCARQRARGDKDDLPRDIDHSRR